MLRSSVRITRRLTWYSSLLVKNHIGGANLGAYSAAWQQQHRFVSSRKDDKFEEPLVEDDPPSEPTVRMESMVSPDDMEFYDPMAYDDMDDDGDGDDDEEDLEAEEEERQKIRDELDARTGRLWSDPWEITEDDWSNMRTSDDLPDWTPDLCSRVSLERIQIHEGMKIADTVLYSTEPSYCFAILVQPRNSRVFCLSPCSRTRTGGIPTLSTLAKIPLPPPPPPHIGHGEAKAYAKARKRKQYDHVATQVAATAEPQIGDILKLESWQEKQDAVDKLFEDVEFALKEQEQILAKHPNFGEWVERALEEYLRNVKPKDDEEESKSEEKDGSETVVDTNTFPTTEEDAEALPVFVDLYDGTDEVVPKILHPLKPHARDGPGRMVEEWELSAHNGTKRILLRQCTRQVARALDSDSNAVRVYVTGHRGVGKVCHVCSVRAAVALVIGDNSLSIAPFSMSP